MNIYIKDICVLSWTKVDERYDAYCFNTRTRTIHKTHKFIRFNYNFNFYKL